MKVVIIGGGTAGVGVATGLRRRDENAEIVILEKSDEFAVARPGLTDYLSGKITDPEQLQGATVEQMAEIFKITVKLGHEVVNLDRRKKQLIIEGHDPESYDKLVLATGALTLRPDIPGILGDNIFTISNFRSVQKIRDYYLGTGAKKVLILGGGEIGIATAEACQRLGAEVTIVEAQSHILPYFDEDMTALLQNHLRDGGIKLYTDTLVTRFDEDTADLDNGSVIAYDLAIICTGVKPDVKIPVMADLELGVSGGLWVNSFLQTNDKDIYACGDNIEVVSLVTGEAFRWPSAALSLKESRVAAVNLAGGSRKFAPVVGTSLVRAAGYCAVLCGASEHNLRSLGVGYRCVHLLQKDHDCYLPGGNQMILKLLFTPEGKILGAQGVGKSGIDKRIDLIAEIIRKGGTYLDLLEAEIAYGPEDSAARDAVNNLGSLAAGVVNGETRYVFITELDWCKVGNEIMLIDTRSPQLFKTGHIAHAVNIPLKTLRENLASIPRDRQVVLYCGHGYGAYNAYCLLNQRGYDNVYLLSGSMDLYMEIMLNEIYNEHAAESMEEVWNRLQYANDDDIVVQ